MPHRAITTLQQTLRPLAGLSKSRLEALCLIVVGMLSARTVTPDDDADVPGGAVKAAWSAP